eukprot:8522694-Ditylum_brightwellii.AAC.1
MVTNCVAVWKSALQFIIAQSMMETKYVALPTACRDLLPLKNLLEEVSVLLGLTKEEEAIHTMIWEDTKQALKLTTTGLLYTTPLSRYHVLIPSLFKIKSILTADQQGDLFTKGLHSPVFTKLRKAIL